MKFSIGALKGEGFIHEVSFCCGKVLYDIRVDLGYEVDTPVNTIYQPEKDTGSLIVLNNKHHFVIKEIPSGMGTIQLTK